MNNETKQTLKEMAIAATITFLGWIFLSSFWYFLNIILSHKTGG